MYCKCHKVLTVEEAQEHLKQEMIEFLVDDSPDEKSDVIYSINRLAGAILGVEYHKTFDGDDLHIEKINRRMEERGCIRSENHMSCKDMDNMNAYSIRDFYL